jgi:apolipoprotein N-acyltransferase
MVEVVRSVSQTVAGWSGRSRTLALAAALAASAFGMALSTGSSDLGALGWVTLLPLFQAIRVLAPLEAAVAGGFWGACVFGSALLVGGLSLRTDLTGLALITAIPAVYAGLGAGMTRRIGFSPYLLALGWIGVEFALHPLGLVNGLLAATQGDGFALRILGSFAGYVLVAFVVAYINATLLCVLSQVRKACGGSRFSGGGSGGIRQLITQVQVVPIRTFIRQAQPRGPPR